MIEVPDPTRGEPADRRRLPRAQAALVSTMMAAAVACGAPPEPVARTLEGRLIDRTTFAPCRPGSDPKPSPTTAGGSTERTKLTPATGHPPDCSVPMSAAQAREVTRRLALDDLRSPLARAVAISTVARDPVSLAAAARELAHPSQSADPTALVARAALLHATAGSTGSAQPLLEAFELLARARSLAPQSASWDGALAMRFNRALIAGELGLCRTAALAWRDYIAHEPDPSWRDEATARKTALSCVVAPVETLDRLLDEALDQRVERFVHAPNPAAQEAELARLTEIGYQLAAAGEPLVRDLATQLADPRWLARPGVRAHLAAAADGRAAFLARDYQQAKRLMSSAEVGLRHAGSVLAPWCRYWELATRLYEGELSTVRRELAALAMDHRSGPYLRGRARWSEGLAAMRQGRRGAALDRFAAAHHAFDQAGLPRSRAAVGILRAEVLIGLGQDHAALPGLLAGIHELNHHEPYFVLHNGLLDMARLAERLGHWHTGSAYLIEAGLLAEARRDPIQIAEIRVARGELELRRGAAATARPHFAAAVRLASSIPGGERVTKGAELGLHAADEAESDPRELLRIADYYALKGPASLEVRSLQLASTRARQRRDKALAEESLRRALSKVDQQRNELHQGFSDVSFAASLRQLFDDAIDAALASDDMWAALELTARAAPRFQPRPGAEPSEDFRTRLLADLGDRALLAFRFLDDDLLWWTVADGTLRMGRIDKNQASRVARDLQPGGRLTLANLGAAYEVLLAGPLATIPEDDRVLLIVADRVDGSAGGDLTAVPFAALWNPRSRVHLIERHPLSFAMSPGQLPIAPTATTNRSWRLLAVGDPAFDRSEIPWLERLPGAAREAQSVAALYQPAARLLLGEAATATALTAAIRNTDVIHLATHTIAGNAAGSQSALVLAADADTLRSGLVTMAELDLEIDGTDLVVLSACSSLAGAETGNLIGLAGPFLAAGVPAVAGTLWDINDRDAEELFVAFHQQLRRGMTASAALQAVQRAAIAASPEDCCEWAALALIGDALAPAAGNGSPARAER